MAWLSSWREKLRADSPRVGRWLVEVNRRLADVERGHGARFTLGGLAARVWNGILRRDPGVVYIDKSGDAVGVYGR